MIIFTIISFIVSMIVNAPKFIEAVQKIIDLIRNRMPLMERPAAMRRFVAALKADAHAHEAGTYSFGPSQCEILCSELEKQCGIAP